MAGRRRRPSTRQPSSVDQGTSDPWPNLQELIDSDGQITIGRISQFIDAAIANDEHTAWVMLQRKDGESLVDLMTRLDQALQKAIEEEEPIDEINPP